jgi:hypothetical protein
MKKIKALTLAGLIGLIAAATGSVNEAAAQAAVDYKPGADRAIIAIQPGDQGAERGLIIVVKPGELLPAVVPTDQRQGLVQQAYGDALGRKAGDLENTGLIGLLRPAEKGSITDGTVPTDQRGGYVQGVYGNLLGRQAGEGEQKVQKAGPGTLTLGSLNGLRSTSDLFANSRGGDQGNGLLLPAVQGLGQAQAAGNGSVVPNDQITDGSTPGTEGLLLPAVQKVREAAARSTNGVAGGVEQGSLNFTRGGETRGLNLTNQGATKGLNFANSGNTAGAGPHVSPAANKSLNFTVTAKK